MRPNILFLISQFYPLIGGAEKQAERQAQELIRRGYKVIVLTGRHNSNFKKNEIISNVYVYRYDYIKFPFFKGISSLISIIYNLYLLRNKYDLIHVHQVLYPAYAACIVGKFCNKPVIAKAGSSGLTSDIYCIYRVSLFGVLLKIMRARNFIFNNISKIICLTQKSADELKSVSLLESKIEIISNGVSDTETKKYINDDHLVKIVSIGRISYEKGFDVLVEAVRNIILFKNMDSITIVGGGPDFDKIKELIKVRKLENVVRLAGQVGDVGFYLSKAEIFILPSRSEGMSNVLLEAMSYGLACIATNVGGNIDLLAPKILRYEKKISDGEFLIGSAGILVNSEDSKGMAKAITYLIENKSTIKKLGNSANMRIKNEFTMDKVMDKYEKVYSEIMDG